MITEPHSLLFWLTDTDGYFVQPRFAGGKAGISRHDVGGMWEEIAPELLESMVKDGLLGSNYTVTPKGAFSYWDKRTKDAEWRKEIA